MTKSIWQYSFSRLFLSLLLASILFGWLVISAESATTSPSIEIANISGIEGQTIGVFGNDFGATQGSVTILGVSSTIGFWSSDFISLTVPTVADGVGVLEVTTSDNLTATSPFTVYTVDGNFLVPATPKLINLTHGKTAVTQNVESSYCFEQPGNASKTPNEFLTDFHCGFSGYTNSGNATFLADSTLTQTAFIAIDIGQTLLGSYYFQFSGDNNWYPRLDTTSYRRSVPRDYTIEVSADSTTGFDGAWTPVFTMTNNNRSQRTHHFTVPSGGYEWVRLHVTDGVNDHTTTAGRDFSLREVSIYEAQTVGGVQPDSVAHYGDSLSADAFQLIGPQGFAELARAFSTNGATTDLMFSNFGLSGQNSSGFIDQPAIDYDIYDALTLDGLDTHALYWAITIGVNDAFEGEANLTNPSSNLYQYPTRLNTLVQALIAQGRTPILARIPDTDESNGGFGDFASKKHVLEAIDTAAATYHLIPGPDLYTAFRRNIETDSASFFSGDGTHHNISGQAKMVSMWAEAFAIGTEQTLVPTNTTLQSSAIRAESPHQPLQLFTLLAIISVLVLYRTRLMIDAP